MTDRPETYKAAEETAGLVVNDVELRRVDSRIQQRRGFDPCESMGLVPSEVLIGGLAASQGQTDVYLTSGEAESKEQKFIIPKHLEQAVKDLASSDYETSQKAMRDLAAKATLQELIDIRYKLPDLDVDQGLRLNLLIKDSVEKTWQKFSEDPKKFKPDVSDPKVLRALLTYLPKELEEECKNAYDEARKFLFETGAHTAKDYEKTAGKLERVAIFCRWVEQAAKSEGATADIKRLAADLDRSYTLNHVMTKLVEVHEKLAKPDAEYISDAKDVKEKTRQLHAQAARQTYLDLVESKKFGLLNYSFERQTLDFLKDKTVDDEVYAKTIKVLTDQAIKDDLGESWPNSGKTHLLALLGAAAGDAPAGKAKLLARQYDRLAADLETRVAKISDPQTRLGFQTGFIEQYISDGQLDKARLLLARAQKTVEALPKDEQKRSLDMLEKLNDKLKK